MIFPSRSSGTRVHPRDCRDGYLTTVHFNASRRNVLVAGLGVLAMAVAGCTRAVQTRTQSSAGSATPSETPPPAEVTTTTAPLSVPATRSSATSRLPVTTSSKVAESTVSNPSSTTTRARPTASRGTKAQPLGPARQVAAGPGDRPQVALTFHGAGDLVYARQILQIARAKNAHITVMAVGTWLADNPQIGRQILAAGHEIGNHTLSHIDINSLSEEEMRVEVVGCRDILRRTTGTPGSYFRQSQSQTANTALLAVAGQAGYRICLSYNLDSMDFTDPGPQAIRANVAAAGPGAIVSMHLGHSGTVTALPDVLDDLRQRGLAAVTVTTLLSA